MGTIIWLPPISESPGLSQPDGRGLNIAHEAVDRHAISPRRDKVAFRWLGKEGAVRDITYGELRQLTNRFANVLDRLGVGAGDRVYVLAGRIPELNIAGLGTLKHRSVFCPLFSAFGPEPIRARLRIGQASVLVTTQELYERKVAPLRDSLPDLEHVLVVSGEESPPAGRGIHDLRRLLAEASDDYIIPQTDPNDLALLHFTSGTTGTDLDNSGTLNDDRRRSKPLLQRSLSRSRGDRI